MLNLQLIEEYCKAWNLDCNKIIKETLRCRYCIFNAYDDIFRGQKKWKEFVWYIKYKYILYMNLFVYNFVNKTRRIVNG